MSQITRRELFPGVWLRAVHTDKFKSAYLSLTLLTPLAEQGRIQLPTVPEGCVHNGHMFYIKVKDLEERSLLIRYLDQQGVNAVFHYIPLHTAPAGLRYGRFHGEDVYTTRESERLLRLPMYYGLREDQIAYVAEVLYHFFDEKL